MKKTTAHNLNPKYTPSFEEGDVVILKKDCYSYSRIAEFDGDLFKENCACGILQCGLSHFYVDKNNQFIEHVEDCEWCYVESIVEEEEKEEEEDFFGGRIRAKDLRLIYEPYYEPYYE